VVFIENLLADTGQVQVLDIGARQTPNNPPPYQKLLEAGHIRLTAIDADELDYQFGTSRSHDIRGLNMIIGDGKAHKFYQCIMPSKSSLFEPNQACTDLFQTFSYGSEITGSRDVKTCRMDDIPDLGIVDWLVMDIQGAEDMVLKGGPETLKNTMVLQSEFEFVEQYKGQPLFGEVDCEIRKHNFQFHSFLGYGTRTWAPMTIDNDPVKGVNQWLWADAVYVKHPEYWVNIESKNLIKLAIIMHDAYQSWDLAHALLTHVDKRNNSSIAASYIEQLQTS